MSFSATGYGATTELVERLNFRWWKKTLRNLLGLVFVSILLLAILRTHFLCVKAIGIKQVRKESWNDRVTPWLFQVNDDKEKIR